MTATSLSVHEPQRTPTPFVQTKCTHWWKHSFHTHTQTHTHTHTHTFITHKCPFTNSLPPDKPTSTFQELSGSLLHFISHSSISPPPPPPLPLHFPLPAVLSEFPPPHTLTLTPFSFSLTSHFTFSLHFLSLSFRISRSSIWCLALLFSVISLTLIWVTPPLCLPSPPPSPQFFLPLFLFFSYCLLWNKVSPRALLHTQTHTREVSVILCDERLGKQWRY